MWARPESKTGFHRQGAAARREERKPKTLARRMPAAARKDKRGPRAARQARKENCNLNERPKASLTRGKFGVPRPGLYKASRPRIRGNFEPASNRVGAALRVNYRNPRCPRAIREGRLHRAHIEGHCLDAVGSLADTDIPQLGTAVDSRWFADRQFPSEIARIMRRNR